jgi:hypothetical protein
VCHARRPIFTSVHVCRKEGIACKRDRVLNKHIIRSKSLKLCFDQVLKKKKELKDQGPKSISRLAPRSDDA